MLKKGRNHDDLFLLAVRDELMKIGHLTDKQAERLLQSSLVSSQYHSLLLHEPPSYWAFSLLHGTDKLWHQDYEMYLKEKGKGK